jgi:hypothetical protein
MKAEQMLTEIDVPRLYIKYRGVWNYDDLYAFAVNWFRDKKFKFHERLSEHVAGGDVGPSTPFGTEAKIQWEAEKKETEYIQTWINIYLHSFDVHPVEVMNKDKKKEKFVKGRIWIELRGKLVLDFEKKAEEKVFLSQLRNFYHKYVIRKKIEHKWWLKLQYEMYDLHALMKERLNMENDSYVHKDMLGKKLRI